MHCWVCVQGAVGPDQGPGLLNRPPCEWRGPGCWDSGEQWFLVPILGPCVQLSLHSESCRGLWGPG